MTPTDMNNFNDLLDDTIIMLNTIKPTLVPVSSAYQTVTSLSPKPLQVPKFTPGPFDVICARGKQAYNHDGNKYFRGIVSDAIEKYSKEENRLQRSMIVTDIVNAIRERGNGFVRLDGSTGEWIACSDVVCREKVGQYFRSALGCRYKTQKYSRSIKKSIKINILPRSDAVRQQQQQQQQSVLLSSTKEEEEDSFPPPLLVQGANKERPMGRKKTKKLHRKSTPRKSTRSEASRMLDALEKKNVLNETIHRHRSYQKQANFYLKMGDKVKAQHYMTLLEADQLKCASVPTTVVDTSSLSDDDSAGSGGDKTNDSRFTMDEEDEDDDGEVDVRVDNEDKDDDDDDEVIVVTVVDGDGCGDDDDTTTDSESDSDSDEDDEHDHDHNHDDSDMNHDNSNNHKDCDILCF